MGKIQKNSELCADIIKKLSELFSSSLEINEDEEEYENYVNAIVNGVNKEGDDP